MLQQTMSNRIGILPGDAIKQHKLQNLQFIKMIQPFLAEAFFEPLAVAIMNCHFFTSSLWIFLAFWQVFL
jgi:hypothetical protein